MMKKVFLFFRMDFYMKKTLTKTKKLL